MSVTVIRNTEIPAAQNAQSRDDIFNKLKNSGISFVAPEKVATHKRDFSLKQEKDFLKLEFLKERLWMVSESWQRNLGRLSLLAFASACVWCLSALVTLLSGTWGWLFGAGALNLVTKIAMATFVLSGAFTASLCLFEIALRRISQRAQNFLTAKVAAGVVPVTWRTTSYAEYSLSEGKKFPNIPAAGITSANSALALFPEATIHVEVALPDEERVNRLLSSKDWETILDPILYLKVPTSDGEVRVDLLIY